MDMGPPSVEIRRRVTIEPILFRGDELDHTLLHVTCPVVEGDAQATYVRVARREEPLAQIRQGTVCAHDVEGIAGQEVLHRLVAKLLADLEQLCLGPCGRAALSPARCMCEPSYWGGLDAEIFEDAGEANVVGYGFGGPANVDVARVEDVVEYFEPELRWQPHEAEADAT